MHISLVSCSLTGSGIETIPHAMSAPVPAVTGGQSSGMMGTRALSARGRSEGPAAPLPGCLPRRPWVRRLEIERRCAHSSCRENGGPPAGLQNAIPDRATCVSDTRNNGIDSMFTRTNSTCDRGALPAGADTFFGKRRGSRLRSLSWRLSVAVLNWSVFGTKAMPGGIWLI